MIKNNYDINDVNVGEGLRYKIKPFEELTFSDNFMFGEVMQDKDTCCDVLEIILGIKIKDVAYVQKEKVLDNIPGLKSIRMDVYAADDDTVYDIEMQVKDRKDIPERSRFYQGLMDVTSLPMGARSYNSLKKGVVIFICHFDPFGEGKCLYTFENRCIEDINIPLNDGSRKIFVNVNGISDKKYSADLRTFIKYLKNPKEADLSESKKVADLHNRVNEIKSNAGTRVEYMHFMRWVEDEIEDAKEEAVKAAVKEAVKEAKEVAKEEAREEAREALEQGRKNALKEMVIKKQNKGKSLEEIADDMEMTVEEVEGLLNN